MTRSAPFGDRGLILAADLDGGLATGSPEARERLHARLRADRRSLLIYVTGRSIGATRALMSEASLPSPNVVIADVGTTVMDGQYFTPVVEVEMEIDHRWPGREEVVRRLEGTPGVSEQEVWAPRRVSFRADEGGLSGALEAMGERVADLPVDLVASGGTYIDVLPRGVNKGSTLRRVIRWLGRDDDDVLVAADTAGAVDLLKAGFRGVAVGDCEPALRAEARDLPNVYLAHGEGASGITEALSHFGWAERAGEGSVGEGSGGRAD